MEKLLDTILSGENLSNEYMAAQTYADWEKFDDACFLTALDRQLAENLLKLSDEIAAKPGLFTITLSAKNIPGATVILKYELEDSLFNGSFQECKEDEIKNEVEYLNPDEIDTNTYIEISKDSIGFLAQTESGDCAIYITRKDFRNRIDKAFNTPSLGM